eukprot:TRINITY_DN3929_c0_g1_i1.p1 TRINITY_DN3929_c0_g1~~TRINITY_DN3929_c0_g1_i1.p1  ORF type:complete len:284 (-),score=-14.53 TRINITY_DN3929_c0_g1_i1:447-1298(-)
MLYYLINRVYLVFSFYIIYVQKVCKKIVGIFRTRYILQKNVELVVLVFNCLLNQYVGGFYLQPIQLLTIYQFNIDNVQLQQKFYLLQGQIFRMTLVEVDKPKYKKYIFSINKQLQQYGKFFLNALKINFQIRMREFQNFFGYIQITIISQYSKKNCKVVFINFQIISLFHLFYLGVFFIFISIPLFSVIIDNMYLLYQLNMKYTLFTKIAIYKCEILKKRDKYLQFIIYRNQYFQKISYYKSYVYTYLLFMSKILAVKFCYLFCNLFTTKKPYKASVVLIGKT